MANSTDKAAYNIHGTNPQFLVEKILRLKIYDCLYWKEHCFGLTAEGIVEKAVQLNCVGGTYGGNRQPTNFMCLILKMLQIQPDKDIIIEFILNEDYKYVRVLGAFYLRLIGKPLEIYQYLEPLLNDYRKIRVRDPAGKYYISHVDEIIDDLLHGNYALDVSLPFISTRRSLEELGQLEPRVSALEDMDLLAGAATAEEAMALQHTSSTALVLADEDSPRRKRDGRERQRDHSPERSKRERSSSRERRREQHKAEREGTPATKTESSSSSSSTSDASSSKKDKTEGGRDRKRSRSKSPRRRRSSSRDKRSRSRSRERSPRRRRSRDRRSRSRSRDRRRGSRDRRSRSRSRERRRH